MYVTTTITVKPYSTKLGRIRQHHDLRRYIKLMKMRYVKICKSCILLEITITVTKLICTKRVV